MYRADLIGLGGQLTLGPSADLNNLVTYSGTSSVLKHLPAITHLVLDNNTNLTSTYNTITEDNGKQLVFTNMTALQKLYIQNCTSLTQDIDLTMCSNITEVDASGTAVNVYVPANAPLTKYEVGTPTEIILDSPTVLSPEGVVVKSYENLDSLELINIPNNKAFRMFGKIMKSMGAEMLPNTWVQNGELVSNSSWMTSTEIYITKGNTVESTVDCYINEYYSDGYHRGLSLTVGNTATVGTVHNAGLDYIRYVIGKTESSATFTDTTANKVLVKWEA